MKKIFVLFCLIGLFAACSSSKINTSKEKLAEVSFGNFGGFTNNSTEYILTGDGQLSTLNDNSTKPLKQVEKKKVQEIEKQLKSIGFEKLLTNDIGNLTYFIKVKTSKYENTVRWNDETQNTELKNTYKMLIEILR